MLENLQQHCKGFMTLFKNALKTSI